ncbi:MAG: hypothetical protein WC309_03635 [Candidatus Paceibacterota bacterium]|jgi:membrane-associated HD superfamily phosphohydrolase
MNTLLKIVAGVSLLALFLTPAIGVFAQSDLPSPSVLPSWTASEALGLVGRIINWIFTFLMVLVVIMVIVAGFTFATGGGNPDNVAKARNMLMYALVGFAVGMMAKGIIALVEAFIGKNAGPNPFM